MTTELFEDRELTCVDCGSPFVFTGGEQRFYAEKGFTNEPKRCKPCRAAKKQRVEQAEKRAKDSPHED